MTDQITQALRSLGAFANGIIPSRVAGLGLEPTMDDARAFQNDLYLLAAKVDAVIEAYGEYLQQNGMLKAGDVQDHFKDVLHNAIDGNATFCIEDRTRERVESLAQEFA